MSADGKPWGDATIAGDSLREWRVRHKMSQKRLAEMVGTHQPVISKWESGVRRPIGLYAEALRRVMSEVNEAPGSSRTPAAP